MQKRLYLDTSVFGGYFDIEFDFWTKILFDQIYNEQYFVLYSYLTDNELLNAPLKVQELVKTIPIDKIQFIEISDKALELAELYINETVVGSTSISDCIHIALATIYDADILVSWNFKHIVNEKRIHRYNSVNLSKGFKILEIMSPKQILTYEE
jgi:hypothetical protein